MSKAYHKPTLVTGSPRSGTTWVGRVLATSPQLYYIHEPFNPDFGAERGICNTDFKHHQTYISKNNEAKFYKPIKKMVNAKYSILPELVKAKSIKDLFQLYQQVIRFKKYRRLNMRPLVKDPIAIMSAGWLSTTFDMNVVLMVRHPAAFVLSMKRLNWSFHPSRWVFSQPQLVRDFLSPIEDEIKYMTKTSADIVERTALMWKVIYYVVLKYKELHPDWIYIRHEDISLDPLSYFKSVFQDLGLEFTGKVQQYIVESSNESNPTHSKGKEKLIKLNSKKNVSYWKDILPKKDVTRIKKIVLDVSKYFYSDNSW